MQRENKNYTLDTEIQRDGYGNFRAILFLRDVDKKEPELLFYGNLYSTRIAAQVEADLFIQEAQKDLQNIKWT